VGSLNGKNYGSYLLPGTKESQAAQHSNHTPTETNILFTTLQCYDYFHLIFWNKLSKTSVSSRGFWCPKSRETAASSKTHNYLPSIWHHIPMKLSLLSCNWQERTLQNADPTLDMKYQYQLSPKDDILQLVFVLMIILMHTIYFVTAEPGLLHQNFKNILVYM
jgi:hypothetical protein